LVSWRLAASALAAGLAAAQPPPTLADVLARAGDYVAAFEQQLSGVVSEEVYTQDVRAILSPGMNRTPRVTHRELKSDVLLVRPVGVDYYVQFRDVFEVDRQPVRDRSERLVKLFLSPTASTAGQVREIMNESARYNIGNIERTVNVPVFALAVLEPANQRFFRFKPARRTGPSIPLFTPPAGAFVIEYEETGQHTMIRTSGNRDIPSRGRFWIDEVSGRVLMTELIASDPHVAATIVVRYDAAPSMSLLVPVEMRERYENRRDSTRIDGAATYGTFRQFKVQVDEKLAPIK